MKCETCGRSLKDGIILYRQNDFGVKAIWKCTEHNQKEINPGVKNICEIINSPPQPEEML